MLGLLALTLAVAPAPFERTYSFWLGPERVGGVHVRFDGSRFRYESTHVTQRAGAAQVTSFWCETDAAGRGRNSEGARLEGPLPSTLALGLFADGEPRRCLPAEDEHDGHRGEVCAERHGAQLEGTLLGEPFTAVLGDDGAPEAVLLPQQGSRFLAEHGPLPPPHPHDLFGKDMPGPDVPRPLRAAIVVTGRSSECEVRETLSPAVAAPLDVELPPLGPPSPLRDVARDATRGDRTVWAAARHLAAFVDHAIAPSPPDVDEHDPEITWKRRHGGCVGHAAIFDALARSLGLSVRTVYGLLFEDGAWHVHAWSEVKVGDAFVGLDPSRGGHPLGPEHLAVARDDDPDPLRPGRCLLALPSMRWAVQPNP